MSRLSPASTDPKPSTRPSAGYCRSDITGFLLDADGPIGFPMTRSLPPIPCVVGDVLTKVAYRPRSSPLLDMHQFVNDELAGSLRFCCRTEPLHHRRLHIDPIRQRHCGDALHPEPAEPGRCNSDLDVGGIDPGHIRAQGAGVDTRGAQDIGCWS